MQTLVVNASALRHGGALTILKQFLFFLDKHPIESYVFVDEGCDLPKMRQSCIHLIPINTRTAWRRIQWEWFGLKRWLKKKALGATTVLSLQNTSMRIPSDCQQYIYLHQALVLHDKTWSFFKKEERPLTFYKYLYPFFIFAFARHHTHFIVQTQWMKNVLHQRYRYPLNDILVYRPDVMPISKDDVKQLDLPFEYVLFYPAHGALFKNHAVVIQALALIKQQQPTLSIAFYITLESEAHPHLVSLAKSLNVLDHVMFVGTLTYTDTLRYYQSCTTVVFPSYIESFGLPLIEGAQFNKPVVAANEPYAQEVIGDYEGALFVADNTSEAWRDAILASLTLTIKQAYCPALEPSWPALIQRLIQR